MGSDDILLKEIDTCVNVWTRQCGKALSTGSLDDYYMQKNQVIMIVFVLLVSFVFGTYVLMAGCLGCRYPQFKSGDDVFRQTPSSRAAVHVNQPSSSWKLSDNLMNHFQSLVWMMVNL